MADKLVSFKDADGNILYPKIKPQSIDDGSITKEKLAEAIDPKELVPHAAITGQEYYIDLTDRQIQLLEARDVISVEVCGRESQIKANGTTGLQYFMLGFGKRADNNTADTGGRIETSNSGVWGFKAAGVPTTLNWQNSLANTYKSNGVGDKGYDRLIAVIDRKNGVFKLYEKPGKELYEYQDDEIKCSNWFRTGDKRLYLNLSNANNIWAIRVWDCDISLFHYNGQLRLGVYSDNFLDSLLPYSAPAPFANCYSRDDAYISLKETNATPYNRPKGTNEMQDDGFHMTATAAGETFGLTPYTRKSYENYNSPLFVFITEAADFKVVKGSVNAQMYLWPSNTGDDVAKGRYNTVVFSITDSDGNSYEESDTLGPGTYKITMMHASLAGILKALEADTEVVAIGSQFYCPRVVISVDPRACVDRKIYDSYSGQWYMAKDNANRQIDWQFAENQFGAVSPSELGKPARRGDMKIDDKGNVFIGVVDGNTQVWKQINNA